MRIVRELLTSTLVGGLLILLPIYLTVLILLKGMQSVALLERLPGYGLFRSLTQRVAGEGRENAWKPALVEIEDALVPAFIIEEVANDRFTVFVPSVPTPLAGAVYILNRERVHPLDVSFTQAIGSISRWGSGSKELVAAMPKA